MTAVSFARSTAERDAAQRLHGRVALAVDAGELVRLDHGAVRGGAGAIGQVHDVCHPATLQAPRQRVQASMRRRTAGADSRRQSSDPVVAPIS